MGTQPETSNTWNFRFKRDNRIERSEQRSTDSPPVRVERWEQRSTHRLLSVHRLYSPPLPGRILTIREWVPYCGTILREWVPLTQWWRMGTIFAFGACPMQRSIQGLLSVTLPGTRTMNTPSWYESAVKNAVNVPSPEYERARKNAQYNPLAPWQDARMLHGGGKVSGFNAVWC